MVRCPKVVGDRVLVRVATESITDKYKKNEKTGVWEEWCGNMFIKALKPDEIEREQLNHTDAYVVQVGWDAYKGLGSGQAWCEVGNKVWLNRYSGDLLPDIGDGHTYRLISDSDVMVVWDGEDLNDR